MQSVERGVGERGGGVDEVGVGGAQTKWFVRNFTVVTHANLTK